MSLKKIKIIKSNIFYFFHLFILLILVFDCTFATEITGDIYEDTVWDTAGSPYIITNTIRIFHPATLTIKPGVIVKFDSDCSIQVEGGFAARGTGAENIYFIQNKENVRWGTIKFKDSSVDAVYDDKGNYISGSIIEYARIEGAGSSGIYCWKSSPAIYNNTIINNLSCQFGGGGIYCTENSNPNIYNNSIIANKSDTKGGGIYCDWDSSPVIYNNIIMDNETNDYGYGGGIFCIDYFGKISKNKIINNKSLDGGGIYCYNSSPIISYNTITNNLGSYGGGIFCFQSSTLIYNNIIRNNSANYYYGFYYEYGGYGGGICCGHDYNEIICNNIITNNSADDSGGGIYTYYSSSDICYNNVSDNENYNIYNKSAFYSYITAQNNWWGSAERNFVGISIFGNVIYSPYLTSATPILISSVELKSDCTYSTKLSEQLFVGDTIFVELVGVDGDSTSYDNTNVLVKSEGDTAGISVKLKETDFNSGVYRGISIIGDKNDDTKDIIGASQGGVIRIFSAADISIYDSVIVSKATSIELFSQKIPSEYKLFQNYPNPFNPETHIKYEIPKTSSVEITVYNMLGQKIRTILNEVQNPGVYEIVWNGTNDEEINVSSGVYLYVIKTKDFFASMKMVLLR